MGALRRFRRALTSAKGSLPVQADVVHHEAQTVLVYTEPDTPAPARVHEVVHLDGAIAATPLGGCIAEPAELVPHLGRIRIGVTGHLLLSSVRECKALVRHEGEAIGELIPGGGLQVLG